MSGFTLATTTLASYAEAQVSKASQQTSETAVSSVLDTQLSVQTDLRTTVTTLDPAAVTAVVNSIDASMAGHLPAQRAPMINGALTDLSNAMSQGQGAFFFNFTTLGSTTATGALTPSQVAALLAGHSPDLGSVDGYDLTQVLRTAFNQRQKAAQSTAVATQGVDDPKLATARMALTLLESKGHLATAKTTASADPGDDPASLIRSLVDSMPNETASKTPGGDDSTASVTIIYVPPTQADTTEADMAQSVSTETTSLLDIQA